MPALGFGSTVGSHLPDLANFPADGLSFLYRCDERSGDKLYDATGQWQPLQLYTGSALDCTGSNLSAVDSTGLVAAIAGRDAIGIVGGEFKIPDTVSADNYIIGNSSSTAALASPLKFYIKNETGAPRIYVLMSILNSGGTLTSKSWSSSVSAATNNRFLPGTLYQMGAVANAIDNTCTLTYRVGVNGPWTTIALTSGTGALADSTIGAAGAPHRLLATGTTPATPFTGKAVTAFCAAIETEIETVQRLLSRPTKSYVTEVLGAYGRFWDFRAGEGTTIRELTTGTVEPIVVTAGAIAWLNGQAGMSQKALRQGRAYYGKAGVRLGGSTSAAAGAKGAGAIGASNSGSSFSSSVGWSFQVTAAIGASLPTAAHQLIAAMIEPLYAGGYDEDPVTTTGFGFVYSSAGATSARMVEHTSTPAQVLLYGSARAGNNPAAKGLLSTYTIVTPATTGGGTLGFSVYRQDAGDAAPTKIGDYSDTKDFRQTFVDHIRLANAAFEADINVGFVAAHTRTLTVAEMAQCHRSALGRMDGEPIYVDVGAGNPGNGTENYPYDAHHDAKRRCQPGQIIHVGGGTYAPMSDYTSANRPSSTDNLKWYTGGAVVFAASETYTDEDDLPLWLDGGSWTFEATSPGYFHFLANGTDTPRAGLVAETVESFILRGGKVSGGFAASGTTGSGFNLQGDYIELIDVEVYDNDEHGLYFRIQGGDADKAFKMENIYCHDNGEDGVKFSSELGDGASWVGTGDVIRVDGGQNQLWLAGVKDSVFTNLILENQASAGTTGALYLGYAGGTDGEDTSVNNVISNVTIYNAVTAVLDQQSTGTTIQNLVAVDCTNDFVQGELGTAVITYSVGLGDANPLPTDPTNIPESADLALVDPDNLDPDLRDFNLAEGVDGEGDGVNLTTSVPQAATDYAGNARPTTGAWNMGAY